MALADIRLRMQQVLQESRTIREAPGIPTPEQKTKLDELRSEGLALASQLKSFSESADFDAEQNKSAGMLALAGKAGGATVTEIKQTGQALVPIKDGRIQLDEIDEDTDQTGMDKERWKLISSPEYRHAFKSYLRVGMEGLRGDALKVLQEGIDNQGGFAASDDILNRLLAKQPAPTTLASRVTTLTTAKDRLVVPRIVWTTDNIYTSGMRVTWTGEVPASATVHRVTEPVFGQVGIPIYTAMMSLPLTNDMVEDADFPLVNWCTGKFSETNDLLRDNMIINGTGVNQPSGIIINANFIANHVHSLAAADVTWDGLIDLLYALPEQYDQNAAVYMNKTDTALHLAKLQDGNGRPYWTTGAGDNGLAGQRINRPIMGYDTVFSPFMPNIAASAYPIVFGDLRGYWMINRVGFSIQVLRERYAEENQILMLGRVRFGGQLVEDERVRGQFIAA